MHDRIIAAHYCGHWFAIHGDDERWELVGRAMARGLEPVPAHPNGLTDAELFDGEWYAVDDVEGAERDAALSMLRGS